MFSEKTIKDYVAQITTKESFFKRYMIEQTIRRLIEVTEEFAPGEKDFDTAISIEGPNPNSGHSLIAVEDELDVFMRAHPKMIDVMRDSVEFENERTEDFGRAARALVNESFEEFRARWEAKQGVTLTLSNPSQENEALSHHFQPPIRRCFQPLMGKRKSTAFGYPRCSTSNP